MHQDIRDRLMAILRKKITASERAAIAMVLNTE
jgi:hypothetical protein